MSIGYTPPTGSLSILFTGLNGGGVRGSHIMDLGADPFVGGLTNAELDRRAKARYGPNFHGTDETQPRFLGLDFESLFGIGSKHLSELWQQGRVGTKDGHDGNPTYTELHDFYAVNPDEGISLIAGTRPPAPERPNDPPGCGAKTKPCYVDREGRKEGEVWRESRPGGFIWLQQKSGTPAPPPSPPTPPVEPPKPKPPTMPEPFSAEAVRTRELMVTWSEIGPGRKARLHKLAQEFDRVQAGLKQLAVILLAALLASACSSGGRGHSRPPIPDPVTLETAVGTFRVYGWSTPENLAALRLGIEGPREVASCLAVAVQDLKRDPESFRGALDGWTIVIRGNGSSIQFGDRRINAEATSPSAVQYGARHECITALAYVLRTCDKLHKVDECGAFGPGWTIACDPC